MATCGWSRTSKPEEGLWLPRKTVCIPSAEHKFHGEGTSRRLLTVLFTAPKVPDCRMVC
jgi:hypothetical protein